MKSTSTWQNLLRAEWQGREYWMIFDYVVRLEYPVRSVQEQGGEHTQLVCVFSQSGPTQKLLPYHPLLSCDDNDWSEVVMTQNLNQYWEPVIVWSLSTLYHKYIYIYIYIVIWVIIYHINMHLIYCLCNKSVFTVILVGGGLVPKGQ